MHDKSTPHIAATYAQLLLEYLQQRRSTDMSAAANAEQVTHALESMIASGNYVDRAKWLNFVDQLAQQSGDDAIGLKIGMAVEPRHLGLMGHVLMHCSTLEETIAVVSPYDPLQGDLGGSRLECVGNLAHYEFVWHESAAPPAALEQIWAASSLTLAAWLTGHKNMVCAAHFRSAKPRNTTLFETLFTQGLHFEQNRCQLIFPIEYKDLPIALGNPSLRALAESQAKMQLTKLVGQTDLTDKVRLVIAQHLHTGAMSQNLVAAKMHLSTRSLHRHLSTAGCTFRDLVETVRREQAELYLQQDNISLAEAAQLLGYGEQSTFQSAFKRWTGKTPNQYRQNRLQHLP